MKNQKCWQHSEQRSRLQHAHHGAGVRDQRDHRGGRRSRLWLQRIDVSHKVRVLPGLVAQHGCHACEALAQQRWLPWPHLRAGKHLDSENVTMEERASGTGWMMLCGFVPGVVIYNEKTRSPL